MTTTVDAAHDAPPRWRRSGGARGPSVELVRECWERRWRFFLELSDDGGVSESVRRRLAARALLVFTLDPETAQYSTTKFLLARCDLFTAVNALERAECVLKLPSIVKVAATRQNAAGSPQTVAIEAKPPEDSLASLRH